MTKEEHVEYLKWLKEGVPQNKHINCSFGLTIPKKEGAFYFGEGLFYDEYVEEYEKACRKEGWIND